MMDCVCLTPLYWEEDHMDFTLDNGPTFYRYEAWCNRVRYAPDNKVILPSITQRTLPTVTKLARYVYRHHLPFAMAIIG